MSNIDEVIARSRQKGEFSERKSFSVARERAIQKMRQFALADPHYYVLELIQAAIANQATHVDMRIKPKEFILSYVGGGFGELELSQIFDFLFASKSDVSTGALRQLALGINALMRFEPEQIILESGDGTLPGTTRVEVDQRRSTVNVGTPEAPLNGTFLRASGLKRSKIHGQSRLESTDYGPPECAAIENRCLSAPVPIIVNGRSLFGFASVRTPNLIGFNRVIHFDEGDLYGSIGDARQAHNRHFKLLTWGVWVQSVEYPLVENAGFGGIITFNRLNKTADHAAIVRDERLEELWARLRPYVRQALNPGKSARSFQISLLDGESLTPPKLRKLVEANPAVISISQSVAAGSPQEATARDIGAALNAPIIRVADDDFGIFADIADISTHVLRPRLDAIEDVLLFNGKPLPAPPRPWFLDKIDGPSVTMEEMLEYLGIIAPDNERSGALRKSQLTKLKPMLDELGGPTRSLTSTIYTPHQLPPPRNSAGTGVWAQLRVFQHVVWEGFIMAPFPGHVLSIDVMARSASILLEPNPADESQSLAEGIAHAVSELAWDQLESASLRALAQLDTANIQPGTSGAYIALAALARKSILALQNQQETDADDAAHKPQSATPSLRFTVPGDHAALQLLDAPLFATVDDKTLSFRDLEAIMRHTNGLVYGCVPRVEAALKGLDPSRILKLDLQTEALLAQIIGYGAYIRVDSRDILAKTSDGQWLVRDLASGLRRYPDNSALLVEGPGVALGETLNERIIEELVIELKLTRRKDPDKDALGEALEARRQATRHLQYFVCRRRAYEPDLPTYGVEKLPLFLDEHRRQVSLEQICRGFETHETIVMLDGRAGDNSGYRTTRDADSTPRALMLDPWSYHLLSPLGRLAPAIDTMESAEISDLAALQSDGGAHLLDPQFLVSRRIDSQLIRGIIGLASPPADTPMLRVISANRRRSFFLRQTAVDFGVSGTIQLKNTSRDGIIDLGRVNEEIRTESIALLHSALDELLKAPDQSGAHIMMRALLHFGARHVEVVDRGLGPDQLRSTGQRDTQWLTRRIFDTPFFQTESGVPVSARRLLRQAFMERYREERLSAASRIELTDEVPEEMVEWLTQMSELRPARPKTHIETRPHAPSPELSADDASFTRRLALLLEWLRPDPRQQAVSKGRTDIFKRAARAPTDQAGPPATRRPPAQNKRTDADAADAETSTDLRTSVYYYDHADRENATPHFDWRFREAIQKLDKKSPFYYIDIGMSTLYRESSVYRHDGSTSCLLINQDHWLVKQAVDAAPGNAEPIAWLLLGAYAYINELLEPVTNEHELVFQRRVLDALEAGELQ